MAERRGLAEKLDGGLTTGLFVRMVREEYRLHAELFGRRFLTYPFAIAAMCAGGFWLLTLTDTGIGAITAGVHGLLFFFGLQVGTIGLVGRDALRDVLGDVTLLVFSARTLPVTWRRLLAIFLVKDLAYYSVLFVTPVVVGYGVLVVLGEVTLATLGLLWVSATATFGLGVGVSLTLVGLGTRSRLLSIAFPAAILTGILWDGIDVVALTPYALFESPSLETAALGLAPVVWFGVLGPLLFQPADSGETRTARQLYPGLRSLIGRKRPIATRSILEVARSGGSVWKVLFSMGVLFGVTALLLREVSRATTLEPSAGIAFGTLLGLGAFTTYSWVTQFDAADDYLRFPVSMATVFAGKRLAYLALSVPSGLVYLGIASAWVPATQVALGAVVFPLVATYVFGVTAYVTGLSPNELLFDTPLFALFSACLAAVAVPLVTAALVYPEAPMETTVFALGVSGLSALVGWALANRAGPKWAARIRASR